MQWEKHNIILTEISENSFATGNDFWSGEKKSAVRHAQGRYSDGPGNKERTEPHFGRISCMSQLHVAVMNYLKSLNFIVGKLFNSYMCLVCDHTYNSYTDLQQLWPYDGMGTNANNQAWSIQHSEYGSRRPTLCCLWCPILGAGVSWDAASGAPSNQFQ